MDRPKIPNTRRPTAGELKSVFEWFLAEKKLYEDDTVICVLNRTQEKEGGGSSCWTEIMLRRRDRPFPIPVEAGNEDGDDAKELVRTVKKAQEEASPAFIVAALSGMRPDDDPGEALGHPVLAPFANKVLELGVDSAENNISLLFFPGGEGSTDVSDAIPPEGRVFALSEDGSVGEEVTDPEEKARIIAMWKGGN